jgi:uncharacterized membrane protein YidH (DUF202 family)
MVVAGVIILVIGIALLAVGALGALGSISIKTGFSQPHTGEYVSAEVVLNATSDVVVASPASVGGLVHAQDLSLVNSTNISTYAIPVNSTGAGDAVYRSLLGAYYYVAFASAQPSSTIVATPLNSSAVRFGVVALLGIVLLIVGIIVAIVGALRKKRLPEDQR